MTTNEIAAAERVFREFVANGHQSKPGQAGEVVNTALVLAERFIAERNETAIDEAWLRSVGFELSDGGIELAIREEDHGYEVAVRLDNDSPPRWYYMDRPIISPTTRKDLLRLLAYLGIPTNDAGAK